MVKSIEKKLSHYLKLLAAKRGFCPICEKKVRFIKRDKWLRDHYLCSGCNSKPRNRALIETIKRFYPDWESLSIHESSPNKGASSKYLRARCKNYSSSQFFENVQRGEYKDGHRSEDLSALTFPDNSFDLVITQDVFEHVMEPEKAFSEIARVLKPGGAHIFSMPWYPRLKTSRRRAKIEDGRLVFIEKAEYHGNPINKEKGSLVTFDWGQDFVDIVYRSSGMFTTIYLLNDKEKGIEAEFLEIFISKKQ